MLAGCFAAPPPDPEMPCPVQGPVHFTDDFGAPRGGGTHQGVDIFAPLGTPNVAVADGVALQAVESGYGNYVVVVADDGVHYIYAHLSAFEGASGEVARGDVIGYSGESGNADGVHTHFEMRPGGGAAVSPYPTLEVICTNRV